MKNKVSVIVPIYNVEKYLKKCIESIICQTYRNIEIILVDDGSSDHCSELCSEFKKIDSRIIIITHQTNKGLVQARKSGLNICTGEYVIFVDSDDYIESQLCEKMLRHILSDNCDFVHANYIENDSNVVEMIDKDEMIEMYGMSKEEKINFILDAVFESMIERKHDQRFIMPSLWSKIFRADFIKKYYNLLPNNQSLGEDLLCLCHALMNTDKFSVIKDAYYHYNLHASSLSHNYNMDYVIQTSEMILNLKKLFISYGGWDETKNSIYKYYRFCLWNVLKTFESTSFHLNEYSCENLMRLMNKKIVLYGAGVVGRDYYDQICRYKNIFLVDWIDKKNEKITCCFREINGIDRLLQDDYDVVLIAVKEKKLADNIKKELIELGVDSAKILWLKPKRNFIDI